MFRMAMLAATIAAFAFAGARAEPLKVAVFDLEMVNTSMPQIPPNAAEQARLVMLSERLRAALDTVATIDVVDIGPVRDEAAHLKLQACAGCDRRLGEEVGADVSATGIVNKVSELILNMGIFMRDVKTGQIIGSFNADFRGNTDESWTRALDWLLKNRILPKDTPK